MLSDEEVEDLKEAMYEVYEELFSSGDIEFLQFNTKLNIPDELYHERVKKLFLEPVILTGRVALSTSDEEVRPSGGGRKYDASFTIPLLPLEVSKVIELGEELLLKSRIRYQGVTYRIVDVAPRSNIADRFLKYIFGCKRLRNGE